tara:strand:- start:653 stop:988 length:336 start_codon:yes stop_codon:yes gene_type:complete
MNKLNKLSKYYGFENNEDFFNYIIESHINGQKKQFTELMTKFIEHSSYNKQGFQICILNSCNTFGLKNTISILKKYKTFYYTISDSTIINVFYDNSRSQLDEVKEILLNNY